MTSRNLVRLFMSTLLVGGLTTAIVGLVVRWSELQPYFVDFQLKDIISAILWLVVMGFLFSAISQMGFFAYLTVHRFGLGIFKSASLWNGVQVILILFALFDLVYLRYNAFADKGESILPYLGLAAAALIIGLTVSWFKKQQTNQAAFIPALFFMIVVTIVEWVPVLRVNDSNWLYLMGVTLSICNAYQLLMLHKLNAQSEQERQNKALQKTNHKPSKKQTKKPSI
ncbi:KinB-signaling pathway activation protein [Neobacillus sp. LXY-1]|uniref:KinB-signaling pathway activation protein n=1 Tax=Neobacillus sp. LXY-1 TaxID=3379133 RepID=UPI003EDE960B